MSTTKAVTAGDLARELAGLEVKGIGAKIELAVRAVHGSVNGQVFCWEKAEIDEAKRLGKVPPARFAELATKDDAGKPTGLRLSRPTISRYLDMYERACAKLSASEHPLPAAQDVKIGEPIPNFAHVAHDVWQKLYAEVMTPAGTGEAQAKREPAEVLAKEASDKAEAAFPATATVESLLTERARWQDVLLAAENRLVAIDAKIKEIQSTVPANSGKQQTPNDGTGDPKPSTGGRAAKERTMVAAGK